MIATGNRARGFSTIKTLLWLAVFGAVGWVTIATAGAYYTAWKVQSIFDSVTQNMADRSMKEIREHMSSLYRLQGIMPGDLPQEYFDNLRISRIPHGLRITSTYHVTVWLLGEPEYAEDDGSEAETGALDRLREMATLDFDFSPVAETP